jgi:hypothetical protein
MIVLYDSVITLPKVVNTIKMNSAFKADDNEVVKSKAWARILLCYNDKVKVVSLKDI